MTTSDITGSKALTRVRRASLTIAITSLLVVPILASGCKKNTPATPTVFMASALANAQNGQCMEVNSDWVDIGAKTTGSQGEPEYTKVSDGSTDADGANVSVDCTVTAGSNGTFNVDASASKTGGSTAASDVNVGTITIIGTFTASGTQTNISATFQKSVGTFTESDCTVDYAVSPMGVAAGRVWGILTCPNATYSAQSQTCEATAEFRFENCQQ